MDDIVLAFVNYMLQFFICLQIARFQRVALKRNIIVGITIRDYTWNVKLHNVRLYNGRNK